jgi:hypothetical protein
MMTEKALSIVVMACIMKPLFSANHRWAMAKGEESLNLEIARRHAATQEERALVPAPPQPTTTSSFPLLLGAAGGMALLGFVSFLARRTLAKIGAGK